MNEISKLIYMYALDNAVRYNGKLGKFSKVPDTPPERLRALIWELYPALFKARSVNDRKRNKCSSELPTNKLVGFKQIN